MKIEKARQIAAQIWCEPETANIVMDTVLAEAMAWKIVDLTDNVEEFKESEQLRREIHNVITRYSKEGNISVYQTIGILEIVKVELIQELEKWHNKKET